LVKSLDKWRAKIQKDPKLTTEHLHAVDLSLGRLEWTLYSLNLFVGLALEEVRLFNKPSREKPVGHPDSAETCDEHGDWVPYPVPHTPIDWHPNCHYIAYIALAEVVTADEALYEEKRRSDTQKMALKFEDLNKKVQAWPETLPPCMRMRERALCPM
jgi:hypothetical protein